MTLAASLERQPQPPNHDKKFLCNLTQTDHTLPKLKPTQMVLIILSTAQKN